VDDAVNRYARELIEAINAAVTNDSPVRECRERARAAGIELELSLEVVVGVKDRPRAGAREGAAVASTVIPSPRRRTSPPQPCGMTAADRRFLRSLRIAAEETTEPTA
jgi:hypothetical protein